MSLALDQFVKLLTDSGVLSAGKLEAFIPPKAHPKDVQQLARQLVESKHLTEYQAAEVYHGRAGLLILGNYTILDRIGAGGMGQVFKARHRRMDRVVAIKMLPQATLSDPAALARFQREVVAAARLRHPNIVAADDADEAAGRHFLVMEYVEGQDLSALVKSGGPLGLGKATDYVVQAAKGLEFAHSEGVIHRDIKPANLLVDKKGTVKILDMGLARIESSGDAATQAELTGTGAVMGTVDYMAPEQALSTKHATAQSDIYSLGCTLHYLLTGKATYDGDSLMARLIAHREQPIPRLGANVPRQLQAVFEKMVAKNAAERYKTMAEVIAALESCNISQMAADALLPDRARQPRSPAASPLDDVALRTINRQHSDTVTQPMPSAGTGHAFTRNRKVAVAALALLGLAVLAGVLLKLRTNEDTQSIQATLEPNAWLRPAFLEWQEQVTAMPAEEQVRAVVKKLQELNPKFDGKETHKNVGDMVTEFELSADGVEDISPVRALGGLKHLECIGSDWNKPGLLSDLSPLTGMKLTNLAVTATRVASLSPLEGMQLTRLDCAATRVTDLSPLKAMPLTNFSCTSTQVADISPITSTPVRYLFISGTLVSDLSPLRVMQLSVLYCDSTNISSLSPIAGMPLYELLCNDTYVSDLSALKGMELKMLAFTPTRVAQGIDTIRQMKSLRTLGISWNAKDRLSPDEFWKRYDAGKFGEPGSAAVSADRKRGAAYNDPAFKKWEQDTAKLSAEEQIKAVAKKLQGLNPGFDGKLTGWEQFGRLNSTSPKIENGKVTEFGFLADNVTDISPVRALPGLKKLWCKGSTNTRANFADLSPLLGLQLTCLDCSNSEVLDISPLRGMPLTWLGCTETLVADLSPLEGMPLAELWAGSSPVSDLSPLSKMPLRQLACDRTNVSDLSPLEGMALEKIFFTCADIDKGIEAIRAMKSLVVIGTSAGQSFSADEFWKKYDAGEFK
jgi:serine/threonine protein kinase